jgi:formylglycine-generating enzyme required for sulfatase activity
LRLLRWLRVGSVGRAATILLALAWVDRVPLAQCASPEAAPLTVAPLAPNRERGLKPGNTFKDCSRCPEMVVVPGGSFMMGSPATEQGRETTEGPQHRVTIARPFAVSRFAVTSEEWQACAAQRGCRDDADDGWGDRHPVTGPAWNDAQSYVTWLAKLTGKSYRLLSEAEYEYAARAGTQTAYPWGDAIGAGNASCHACGSEWDNKTPARGGSFPPNKFGLYDMVGNVQSFVEDCWHDSYEGAPKDGAAWTRGSCLDRVVRGGSWARNPAELRSASRGPHGTIDRYPDLGFRVARALER